MEERLPKGSLGGQAVIEGVMMKGKDSYSVAVRKPDKKIEVKLQKYEAFGDKHRFAKIPFIRGVVNFVESLAVGMKTLSYSSSFYEEEEEETKADKFIKEVFKEKAESVIIGITLMLSVVLAIALFMMLPAAIGEFIGKWVDSRILLSLIEGIIRLVIFIVYVVLISQMEDIRRVFMYHGAEHKTINCYEAGDDLTPENVAKHSRYHKRCGTSFLFIVMVVSIIVFMFITAEQMWLRFLLRLILIPAVAGISYEFIRLAGRSENALMNVLSKPGMWIQKLTTKEPEEEMIQVAIISVESVLYGEAYADAVNEAQGLGKKKNTPSTAVSAKSKEQVKDDDDAFDDMLDEIIEDIEKGTYEEVHGVGTEESTYAEEYAEKTQENRVEEYFADSDENAYEEDVEEYYEEVLEIVDDEMLNKMEVERDQEEKLSDVSNEPIVQDEKDDIPEDTIVVEDKSDTSEDMVVQVEETEQLDSDDLIEE